MLSLQDYFYKWMKTRFLVFFLALFLVSCSSKKEHYTAEEVESWPVLKVDSIFKDLDKPIYDKKTAQLDKSFQNLKKKTTFNGTVLFAEKGRIFLEKSYGGNKAGSGDVPCG